MKISPLAGGSGVPGAGDVGNGRSASPDRIAAAKAIAAGQEPVPRGTEAPKSDDRSMQRIERIRMNVQRSTNRHESPAEEVVKSLTADGLMPTDDTNETATASEETKPLSPQFAALAKAKRALQVKEREILQREEALKTQSPASDAIALADLKGDPLSVLEKAGVTYDQLTEAILNSQGSNPEMKALQAKLEALEQKLTGQFTERDQAAENQVLADIKRETIALTSGNEQYEAIERAGAQDYVVELIKRTFKKSGDIMDVKTAAELVENQLIDEALPFAQLKKVQSRLQPAQTEAPQAAQRPGVKVMRTLTNRDNASPYMSRRDRAIAAMNGTLKKG